MRWVLVLGNPSDSVALERIIKNTRGLGESTFAKIVAYAAHNGIPIMHALGLADQAAVAASYVGRCRKLYDRLEELKKQALSPDCSLAELVTKKTTGNSNPLEVWIVIKTKLSCLSALSSNSSRPEIKEISFKKARNGSSPS